MIPFVGGRKDVDEEEEEEPPRRFRIPRRKRPSKRPRKSQEGEPANGDVKTRSQQQEKARRRKAEDNLAIVFLGFAMVFLVCHTPRIAIDLHELLTLRDANACREAGVRGFPPWSIAAINVSHVFLALNSAMTILVYCGLSSKFREEFALTFCKLKRSHAMECN